MNDEEYMEIAYQEALKALKHDDVPIGCIIVKDDQIIIVDEKNVQYRFERRFVLSLSLSLSL